jgi:hypothetical protein
MQGCAGLKGWAALPGDCQPMNAAINPRAQEICNNLDDDCDGDVDERVRPTCGEGWCRRVSPSCDVAYCRAGEPEPERCNLIDDDCDGEIDEQAEPCPTGQSCSDGACVSTSAPSGGAGGSGQPAGNQAGSAPTTAPSGPDRSASASCALGSTGAAHTPLLLALALSIAHRLRRAPRARR